jgi:prevent-host-death family protein
MGSVIRIRNPRGELVEPAQVTASEAKNGFGRVLDLVRREGGVAITRRNEPLAVLISVESYQRLAGAEDRALDSLSAQFDALLTDMQAPGAAAAMQRAFALAPAALGRAAVEQAAIDAPARVPARASKKRAAAKRVRRARG